MIDKQTVYILLRASPSPLNYAGLMALIHNYSHTDESLSMFTRLYHEELDHVLAELAEEGKIIVKFTETAVYEVNQGSS